MTVGNDSAPLVKSKRRVADHGEVFTPQWLVDEMLDLVSVEMDRIDSRVLEPACGSGNFLLPLLDRKFATVELRYGKSDFEKRHQALLALMCIYGIELLSDNAAECRANLVERFCDYVRPQPGDPWFAAAEKVVAVNIVNGNALTMMGADGSPIIFPEWAYLGRGRFQRRDFLYDTLAERASFQGSLWDHFEEQDRFVPAREYPAMTAGEIAS